MSLEAVIVPKTSGIDWDMKKFGLKNLDEVVERYYQNGIEEEEINKIVKSHYVQKAALNQISEVLDFVPIIDRNCYTPEIASKAQAVIALGGDNHFLYVARYLNKQPIIGINIDPQTSVGAVLNFQIDDLEYIRECIIKEKFHTEQWPRLQARLDGVKLPYVAAGEIYIGELISLAESHHILFHHGIRERQKGSGLLVSTGAGLTGWPKGITRRWDPETLKKIPIFPRTEHRARFFLKEDFRGDNFTGDIAEEERLNIISLNSRDGILAFDSDPDDPKFRFDCPVGSRIEISLDLEHPLIAAVKGD